MFKEKSNIMSKKMLNQSNKKSDNEHGSWDTAITDAEKLIRKYKDEIGRLRAAIRIFKEKLESGEPFPGQEKMS